EGKPPKALCAACRDKLKRAAASRLRHGTADHPGRSPADHMRRTLCFQCYRADLERTRAIGAAAALHTTSDERFQFQLPFEAGNVPRLQMLKAERASARQETPPHVDRRRHAQLEARHALQQIAAGLSARGLAAADRERAIFQAVHAAELQLPEA